MKSSARTSRPLLVGALTLVLLGSSVVLISYRSRSPKPQTSVQTERPNEGFRDVAPEAGITFRMGFLPNEQGETFKINLYDHGCGVAVGDYNGDGHDDIYFLNQLGANGLYRNKGDGTFEDVTEAMGVGLEDRICVGATFSDYDNDGDQDLYVTSTRGGNVLFRNEQNRALKDVTRESNLELIGHSQTPVFFDYDRDGWLDLYVVQTASWTTDNYDERQRYFSGKGEGGGLEAVVGSPHEYNALYRNLGNGTFTNVTEAAGLAGRGWSSDAAVLDYDGDLWPDVLVVSMFGRAQLYHNEQNGTFKDTTLEVLGKTPYGGIGAQVFDFNNDGQLDIYIVDMHSDMWMGLDRSHSSQTTAIESERVKFNYAYGPKVEGSPQYRELEEQLADLLDFRHEEVIFGNGFYRNLGEGRFEEISGLVNLETFWPWGIAAGDYDNDGFVDAMVTTGMGYPFYYWPNYLLMNNGKGSFTDRAIELGIEPPQGGRFLEPIHGVQSAKSSRCAATADFNHDGRVDIVTNNFNDRPYLFINHLPARNYIAFQLQGTQSNRDAVGALVRLSVGDQTMVRHVPAAGGYLSHSSKRLHFGLGERKSIEKVEVVWPSGQRQTIHNPAINSLHRLIEREGAAG